MIHRPAILTIAGFDPTGGAGVLADIKTFEKLRCQGMAVQTANTVQTEDTFTKVNWIDKEQVIEQLTDLLNACTFAGVKIGLVHSFEFLEELIKLVKQHNRQTIIVWDPVLAASAGFDFKQNTDYTAQCAEQIDWITPNWDEIKRIGNTENALDAAKELAQKTNVLLKGGHNPEKPGTDFLVTADEVKSFRPKAGLYYEKHGSGCVFSSALVAHLVRGYPVQKAILKTKRYMERLLASSKSRLGIHYG